MEMAWNFIVAEVYEPCYLLYEPPEGEWRLSPV